MEGWIKIHRSMLEWRWYDDLNTKSLFLHLLLKANYEAKKWHSTTIERGQIVTSYNSLAHETGLSVSQIRLSIDKLKATGEITSKMTNKFSVITICNYDSYQDENFEDNKQNRKQNNRQIAGKQQANNKQTATTKEIKNSNNINRKKDKVKKTSFFYLSKERKENFLTLGFALTLLSEGRANAVNEAESAITYNEACGWKMEVKKQNGDTTVRDYSDNPEAYLMGWRRKNEVRFPAKEGWLWAKTLKELSEAGVNLMEIKEVINDFRGMSDSDMGKDVAIRFEYKASYSRLLKMLKERPELKEVIYRELRSEYKELQQARFYSKSKI